MEYVKGPGPRRLRRYFLVGLVVIAPVGVTIWILKALFLNLDSILGVPLREALGFPVPGLGLVLLLISVVVVGWLAHMAVGRQLLRWWNSALLRFPLVGRLYNAVSQIIQTILGNRRTLFIRTVLVPYPTEDVWAVAFVTREDPPEMTQVLGEPCVNVFVPTTPNPTSGFMLVVPRSKTREVDTTVEEAMKLVISAGAVQARLSTAGLDVESLLMDTREWRRKHETSD
jgi:uncharacterized membrane protein